MKRSQEKGRRMEVASIAHCATGAEAAASAVLAAKDAAGLQAGSKIARRSLMAPIICQIGGNGSRIRFARQCHFHGFGWVRFFRIPVTSRSGGRRRPPGRSGLVRSVGEWFFQTCPGDGCINSRLPGNRRLPCTLPARKRSRRSPGSSVRGAVPLSRRQRVRALRKALCRASGGCASSRSRASGTYGLAAGLIGLGIGPGDEVLVPAHTYMATATAVLAVGAIPVIVDIDETITIEPGGGPRRDRAAHAGRHSRSTCGERPATWTRSWRSRGSAASWCWKMSARASAAPMRAEARLDRPCRGVQLQLLQEHDLRRGRRRGHQRPKVAERARCDIDPCHFYWQGRNDATRPFAGIGARASELMGAMLNVQLDRLDGMIGAMRAEKRTILAGTRASRQSRPEAVADEQPRPRLRDAGDVPACPRGSRAAPSRGRCRA